MPSGHLVPSGHRRSAKQAQALATVEATVKVGSPNGLLVLARPTGEPSTSFDGSPQPRLMARPNLV